MSAASFVAHSTVADVTSGSGLGPVFAADLSPGEVANDLSATDEEDSWLALVSFQPGDANGDSKFDQQDLVQVLLTGKYLSGEPATFAQGDWNGDGRFDQLDIVAALSTGTYRAPGYAALAPDGVWEDGQSSLVYDPKTGEIVLEPPAGLQFTSLNIDSAAGIFTGEPAKNLGGSFDNDTDWNIFKGFGTYGPISFGNVAEVGLSESFLLDDLTVVGSLFGGGGLDDVDLIYLCPNGSKDFAGEDFSGRTLSDDCFVDANLTGANFTNADLSDVPLRRARLAGAVMNGAIVKGTDFSETTRFGFTAEQLYDTNSYQQHDLRGITLDENDLSGWSFVDQDLTGASFVDADLSRTDFAGAVLAEAGLSEASQHGFTAEQLYRTASYQQGDLHAVQLDHNDLAGWDFAGVNLSDARLDSSTLTGANLSGANLSGASLLNAQLTGADFAGADVTYTRLGDATSRGFTKEQLFSTASYQNRQLEGIHLSGSNLAEWDFSGQDLGHAVFDRARLNNATLDGADLGYSSFREARLTGSSMVGANLANAMMGDASLGGANLAGANLTNVGLWNSNLHDANLSQANLDQANLGSATVTGADFTAATIAGAMMYDVRGFTPEQLYRTASYQNKQLGRITLAGQDLADADFAGHNLAGAGFHETNLAGADFSGANLVEAQFGQTILQGANLSRADLSGAGLWGTMLTDADFSDARIRGTMFGDSRGLTEQQFYSTASYQEKQLGPIELYGKDLTGWNFADQDLTGARFGDSTLGDADFSGAAVRGADFSNSRGFTQEQLASTASFQSGDLSQIGLGDLNLRGWDFSGMNLSDARFYSSTLTNADFTDATIAGAAFSGAQGFTLEQLYGTASYRTGQLPGISLDRADFREADFAGIDLTGARFYGSFLTDADFSDANLAHADLSSSALRGANLARANLSEAGLYSIDLSDADLSGAILTGAALYGARMAGTNLSAADLRRAADFSPASSTTTENMIWPQGQMQQLHLAAGESLVVRDHELAISVGGEFVIEEGAELELRLIDPNWDSTIRVSPDIVPQLSGRLRIQLDAAADPADLLGTTFDLFDWSQLLDASNRFSQLELPSGTSWDLSRLYDTGQVVLTGIQPVDQHFSPPRIVTSEAFAVSSVTTGDVDGDGDNDVVGASLYGGPIVWYPNLDGAGSFGRAEVVTSLTSGTTDVEAVDIDDDGDIDVIASSAWNNTLAWYPNQGDGIFGDGHVVDSNAASVSAMFVGDIDGDTDVDILITSAANDTLAWYPHLDGRGTFGDRQVITSSARLASDVTAADIDGDGDVDVVASSSGDNSVTWWENMDGDGTNWQSHVITDLALGASSVFVADVDGDGYADVLSASLDADTVAWYRNESGTGIFGPSRIITQEADGARSVFAGDLDDDGDCDVLSASENDNRIVWYANDGSGGFEVRQVISSSAREAHSVQATDIDRDGRVDVLSASSGDNRIAWYRNLAAVEDTRPPTVDIVDVRPDPRIGSVEQLTIVFDEPVVGFDVSDMILSRDGEVLPLAEHAVLTSDDQQTWLLSGLERITDLPGAYQLAISPEGSNVSDLADHALTDRAMDEWSDVRQAGDANLDRRFDQLDIVAILQAGKFLSGAPAVWGEGDWDGDGRFDPMDIVAALQTGNYLRGVYETPGAEA